MSRAGIVRTSIVALLTIVSRATAQPAGAPDPDKVRDAFGLRPRAPDDPSARAKVPEDPRDAFGLDRRTKALDCSKVGMPDGPRFDFGCAQPTDDLADDSVPFALGEWLPATYLLSLPVGDATHDSVAGYALGGMRDEAGVAFAGANGLENRWTIDGAPADNVRTGGADTRIPLVFLDGIYVQSGGFAARDRTSTGGVIDARLRRGTATHELDARVFGSWIGEARHTPITPASYQLRRGAVDPGPAVSASVVGTGPLGPLLGGHAWYAAGIAPSLARTDFTFTASSLVDADGDGNPDGLPDLVTLAPIETTSDRAWNYSVPAMLRLGLDRGVHHVELSLVGSVSNGERYLFNATQQAGGVNATNIVGDGIATWRGEWHDTRARAQLAWHRSMRRESARDPAAAAMPQLLTAYVPTTLGEDPALAEACADGVATDKYPMLANCPIPFGWFASGGAGPLVDQTGDRPSITADVAHRVGNNVVRVGATGEDSRLVTETRFTGGEQLRSLFEGEQSQRRFISADEPCPEDPSKGCPYVDRSTLTYRTRYTAAYVEDTWRAAKDVSVDGGLRWELMWVGPVMHFSNELAPRLGAAWDPLGKGTSRVWTSMGRSFAVIPTGVGSTIIGRDRTADDLTFGGASTRSVDTGAPLLVQPNVKPLAQDELTLGADFAFYRALRVTAWLQGRWLRRGLETTPDGFDNPGHIAGTDAATRETHLFAISVSTAPGPNMARAGYMYGHTVGTWTGAFDPREGAVLYNSTDFDVTSQNHYGLLPTDIGHRVFLEGRHIGKLGGILLFGSARVSAGSGRPRDALGDGGDGIVYLIQRGSAGRGPVQVQTNVRLGATLHGTDITLDVFNVFDRRDATNTDRIYAGGAIHPIDGGSYEDLVFLKTDMGTPATRRTAYDVGTAFQPPISIVLGIRRPF